MYREADRAVIENGLRSAPAPAGISMPSLTSCGTLPGRPDCSDPNYGATSPSHEGIHRTVHRGA